MGADRKKPRKSGRDRIEGPFLALPFDVLNSGAYRALNPYAVKLLIDIGMQYRPGLNGRLLITKAVMRPLGWLSDDVLNRAKRELLDAELIFETVKGRRPNRASWFAVTWATLDPHPDFEAARAFRRGAYRDAPMPLKACRPAAGRASKNAVPAPSGGAVSPSIAPCGGAEGASAAPCGGAMEGVFGPLSAPSGGTHLEKPSAVHSCGPVRDRQAFKAQGWRPGGKPSPMALAWMTKGVH